MHTTCLSGQDEEGAKRDAGRRNHQSDKQPMVCPNCVGSEDDTLCLCVEYTNSMLFQRLTPTRVDELIDKDGTYQHVTSRRDIGRYQ